MSRFYCPQALRANAFVNLPPNAARHVQVLRMQPGQAIQLFDGTGGIWQAEIAEMTRSSVSARVLTHRDEERELATPIHIAISLPANERMDWLVEKATELGATSIQPLMSERSVVRMSVEPGDERSEKKRQHWINIAASAAEQCGRNRLPTIHPVAALQQWLQTRDTGIQAFILHPPGDDLKSQTLFEAVKPAQAAIFLIGPEGGWSEKEVAAALKAGLAPVHLGARVLRAETAPLAVLAALGAREAV